MKTKKCNLCEYRGVNYLVFTEKQTIKVGDRVLTPFSIPLGIVNGVAGGWDMENFYHISNTSGSTYLYGPALSIVAATESEISGSDLSRLKSQTNCVVYLEENKILFEGDKIVIGFEDSEML